MTLSLNLTISKTQSRRLGLYRILIDTELAQYGYRSRTAGVGWTGNASTPATCPFNANQLAQVTISAAADALVHAKNDPNNNFVYVTGASNGWANSGNYPKVTPLGFEDNFLDILAIDDSKGRAQFRTWNGETNDPCVIHVWKNINYDGGLFQAHNGLPGYIVLDYPDSCWVDLNRIIKVVP
jgi:hypothetical protein